MAKKENVALPGDDGTKLLNNSLPLTSKYSISVLAPRFPCFVPGPLPSGWSTSEKTAPKPVTVAGTAPLVPGTKKRTSVTLLPIGEKSRGALKG